MTEFATHFDVAGVTFVELVKRAVANGGDGVRRAFARHPLYALVKLTKSQVCVCSIVLFAAPRTFFTTIVHAAGCPTVVGARGRPGLLRAASSGP